MEAEPEITCVPVVPPPTELAGEEVPSSLRTQVGTKDGKGQGKVPLSLGSPPLVIYPEIPEGQGDEEY